MNNIVVVDFRFPMLYNEYYSTSVRVDRPFNIVPKRDASNRFERTGRGMSKLLLRLGAAASWRAISPVCDPWLGPSAAGGPLSHSQQASSGQLCPIQCFGIRAGCPLGAASCRVYATVDDNVWFGYHRFRLLHLDTTTLATSGKHSRHTSTVCPMPRRHPHFGKLSRAAPEH